MSVCAGALVLTKSLCSMKGASCPEVSLTQFTFKMAGYWPSSFLLRGNGRDGVEVHEHPPNEAKIQLSDEQAWSINNTIFLRDTAGNPE